MAIYFIPLLICLVSAVSYQLSDNRRWAMAVCVLLCVFYCFGFMTGSDWRTYEYWYDNLDFNRFFYGYLNEPGYYLYMMIFKKACVPFWLFFILTKSWLFIVIYKSLFEYSKESGWLSLMYYLPWFGLYFFIDNPMRNCIAVGLFILSVRYVISREFWKFLLMSLLAASFHFTALFVIPLYAVLTKDVRKWVYLLLFVVINVLFLNRDVLVNGLTSVFGLIPYYQSKVITYFLFDSPFAQGKLFSFGMIWQTALFVLILCYKERIVEQIGGTKGQVAFNGAMIYFLLVRFTMSMEMFMRLQLYMSVFVCVCIGLVVLSFEWRSRLMYLCVLFMVSSYVCMDRVTGSARYIPYSNVLEYVVKGDYPSFSARYYYNIKHSPYTREIDVPDKTSARQ